MHAAAQDLGPVTGLAMQRNEAGFDRAFRRPHLLDDADLIVRYVAEDVGRSQETKNENGDDDPDASRNQHVHLRSP